MKTVLLFCILLFLSGYSVASSSDEIEVGEWEFSLYLGEGRVDNPLIKQDDLKINFFPSFTYYGEKFFIDNTTLGYNLIENDQILVDLVGAINEDGLFYHFDSNKNYTLVNILGFKPQVGGGREMDLSNFKPIKRDISYLGGLNVTFITDYFVGQVAYLTDVTGVHGGNELRVSVSKDFVFPWFELYFELGQIRKSADLVRYYYEFRPEELSFLKDKYRADDATNSYYKVQLDVPISESFTVVGVIKETFIGDEIEESFLVVKSKYLSSFIGIRYRF